MLSFLGCLFVVGFRVLNVLFFTFFIVFRFGFGEVGRARGGSRIFRCLVWGTLLWFGVRIEVQFFEFLGGIKLGREMRT